ncbi:MAG: hypothetical protein H5T33_04275 [Candidatus Methanosuratus sp.]|nr:hypothetical protein [Candidatus Methanosuratincola sp.]
MGKPKSIIKYSGMIMSTGQVSLGVLKGNGRKERQAGSGSGANGKSLNFNQSGFRLDAEGKKETALLKVGSASIKLHRAIKGKIKGVLVKREPPGKWFAIFSG